MVSYAQEEVKPDSLAADSSSVESLELVPMQVDDSLDVMDSVAVDSIIPIIPYYTHWNENELTDLEMRALDWSLQWIDTSECVIALDTTSLPDSVYKARLQALPCVIELPYNERVRAFILRYVKRNPKQVSRMMRMKIHLSSQA